MKSPTRLLWVCICVFGLCVAVRAADTGSTNSQVRLTGIVAIPGIKRALLVVEKGRGSSETASLTEGQSDAGVEVLQIDEKRGRVKVRTGGKEQELSLSRDGIPLAPTPVQSVPAVTSPSPTVPPKPALVELPTEAISASEFEEPRNPVVVIRRNSKRPALGNGGTGVVTTGDLKPATEPNGFGSAFLPPPIWRQPDSSSPQPTTVFQPTPIPAAQSSPSTGLKTVEYIAPQPFTPPPPPVRPPQSSAGAGIVSAGAGSFSAGAGKVRR